MSRFRLDRVELLLLAGGVVLAAAIVIGLAGVSCGPSGDALAANRPKPDPAPAAIAHRELWLCVHRQERSSWSDPNPPYWGGLQLGSWFISHYGALLRHPAGTPDRWAPHEQMRFAEGAYRIERYSRSWLAGQWPPSRGVCF